MNRREAHGAGRAIAFGVDTGVTPGRRRTFVQVWDTSEEDQPCNEGPGGFNNILVDEWDIPEERVAELAREHGVSLQMVDVYTAFS